MFKIYFDILINFAFIISFFLTPFVYLLKHKDDYRIAFEVERPLEFTRVIELIIDVLLVIDVALKFLTAKSEEDNEVNTSYRAIAKEYVKGSFILDFLSCVPNLVTGEVVWQVYYFKLLRFLEITKLMKEINNASDTLRIYFITK